MKKESSKLFNSLSKGLNEAIHYTKGKKIPGIKAQIIEIQKLPTFKGKEIRNIRTNLHLTQNTFAQILGVSAKTVEAWESGKNIPQGPAQRMLFILKNNSKALNILGIKS
ncbi:MULTISPECIES: helix-turn-helix domain-containing protein [Leptospira]|uniref:Transcriptional regulator n=1 Tax=Leptospira kirschneri serovar Pomona TaxID=561005 RepID=A0A1T1DWN2_9LEPT|nr:MULTISPECIES: helix-turn-helix domain-containing protein [Leptospira]EMK11334.1 DNA-binding helix-turn-helix protein [Leptospira kirschneri]KXZ28276.1 DNA-binding protein [Leptospira kirschneri]KXZ33822.1 DNA-binding protein [Leptospira sp. ZV016]OOV45249.1 transcriptional regulator [Leptospira kirschneri serovar Pomona]